VAELAGKVAIVTGGASGIGRASAERFIEEGARVVIADVNAAQGEAVARELGNAAAFKQTDVSKAEEIQALVDFAVERFGKLDIMFNNAGIPSQMSERFLDDPLPDFHQVMSINLYGIMAGTQIAGRWMAKNGGGSIINTSSSSGVQPGLALMTYRSAKAAVAHFTKCVAIDLAEYGIRVNGIAPGMIKTAMTTFHDPSLTPEQAEKVTIAQKPVWFAGQPLKRQGMPDDIADSVLFLASDRARHITGVVLSVDGGMTIGDPVNHLRKLMDARETALSE
jgi:NAD(P)-dependent dehydrogenase (short-subunit alcohol dehydrogenase family)